MSIEKRGNAYQVTVCANGRVYRKSSRRWSRTQAREIERKLLDDLHAHSIGRQPRRTFYDAVERWKREDLPRLKPRTRQEALLNARHIARFLEGRYLSQAKDIGAEIRAAWPKLSGATVNRRLAILARLCNLAHREWGWLENPVTLKQLPEAPERQLFLTREQVNALAQACPKSGPVLLLAAYTGIRIGQLLRLTQENIAGEFLLLGTDGKTGRAQLVPIHHRVRKLVAGLPYPLSYAVVYKEWSAARKALGIKARIHDLRHTLASWMLQGGADLMHVRDMLGHSSVQVTQRYAHLNAAHLQQAIRKIR